MNIETVHRAAIVVRSGGIVACPTEAVYGLSCDPSNAQTIQRLLALKQRSAGKGLILIAAEFSQLEDWLESLTDELRARVLPTWPGPVTWLLPARSETSKWLRGEHNTLAVRVTAHPVAAALCRMAGSPLVSTSANTTGRGPARSVDEVRRQFAEHIDYVLEGPLGDSVQPTEIRDAASGETVRP